MANDSVCSRGGCCGDGDGDDWNPHASNRSTGFIFWTVWGAVIGGLVVVLDRAWIAGGLWLATGVLLGLIVEILLSPRMMRVIDSWCDAVCRDEQDEREQQEYFSEMQEWFRRRMVLGELPEDVDDVSLDEEFDDDSSIKLPNGELVSWLLPVPALYSVCWGALLGPFAGIAFHVFYGEPGWAAMAALLGFVFVSSSTAVAVSFTLVVWTTGGWGWNRPVRARHRWLLLISPLLALPLLYHCGKSYLTLPRERRVFASLSKRGAVFGGDPRYSVLGVRLNGPDFANADVRSLRVFPSLDHIDLCGTPVDDSVVGVLTQMRHLRLLKLSGTRISPRGVARLRRSLPACEIVL